MKVAVIAGEEKKEELLARGVNPGIEILWYPSLESVSSNADSCIDLQFNDDVNRIQALSNLEMPLIIVNAVATPSTILPDHFIRINGWNSFLKREITEASCRQQSLHQSAEKLFSFFNKEINWTPDKPGFVAARIICSIINEAYLALEENVSSKAEIDIAMKLGTNYPYGPFEWCEKIGTANVYNLLLVMAGENDRYRPANSLKKEAQKA